MLGRSVGLSKEKVENVRQWKVSDVYSEIEKLVLEYTEELVTNVKISDDLYKRLSNHFTSRQIMVLCMTSGVAGMVNRIHGTFQTEVEEFTLSRPSVKESLTTLKED